MVSQVIPRANANTGLKSARIGHIDPPIWRRVIVPSEFSLFELHCVLQAVMGWEDFHLHEFTVKRQRYALPTPDSFDDGATEDEESARLSDVATPRSTFIYHYDFGDSWLHSILVEKVGVESPAPVPVCTAGARACPPEDSGGPSIHEQREREAAGLALVGQRGDGQVALRAGRATSASRPVWDLFLDARLKAELDGVPGTTDGNACRRFASSRPNCRKNGPRRKGSRD